MTAPDKVLLFLGGLLIGLLIGLLSGVAAQHCSAVINVTKGFILARVEGGDA